jgi:hypothetical protein
MNEAGEKLVPPRERGVLGNAKSAGSVPHGAALKHDLARINPLAWVMGAGKDGASQVVEGPATVFASVALPPSVEAPSDQFAT